MRAKHHASVGTGHVKACATTCEASREAIKQVLCVLLPPFSCPVMRAKHHASVGTGHGARRFQEVRNKRIYKPSNKRTTQEKSSGTGHKQVVVAVVLLFSCAVHPTSALLAWCYLLAKAQAIASCALHQDARESFT